LCRLSTGHSIFYEIFKHCNTLANNAIFSKLCRPEKAPVFLNLSTNLKLHEPCHAIYIIHGTRKKKKGNKPDEQQTFSQYYY